MVLQDGLEAEVRFFTILLLMSSILLGTLAKVREKIVIPLSFRVLLDSDRSFQFSNRV